MKTDFGYNPQNLEVQKKDEKTYTFYLTKAFE